MQRYNWHSAFFVFLFFLLVVAGAQPKVVGYVQATPEPGDGVLMLLRRYEVNTPCNLEEFYRINQLKKDRGLNTSRSYLLPILVCTYNGKSIRTSLGNDDYDWAVRVQQYNDFLFKNHLRQSDFRNDKQLWVPYHFLNCEEELNDAEPEVPVANTPLVKVTTPPGLIRGVYPVFGDKYSRVPLESRSLEGCIYYIVGGHGGPDPGAIGTFQGESLCEDEYAYDVAMRVARNLLSHGATAYIIVRDDNDGIREGEILPCDKDETVWLDKDIPINQLARLNQRCEVINLLYDENKRKGVNYQRLVEIHVDSDDHREQVDLYFYHKIDDAASQELAETMRNTMESRYRQYQRERGYRGSVSPRDLHMLRETKPVSVFIELGNIRNKQDQARLVIEGNRQLVANWLTDGLLKDAAKNH